MSTDRRLRARLLEGGYGTVEVVWHAMDWALDRVEAALGAWADRRGDQRDDQW